MAPKNQRWWLTTDSQSIEIKAPAATLYDMVADMPRMGEWSPECARVEWLEGTTGPAVDARFIGHNAIGPRKMIRWSRRGRVLTADPGREFAFTTEEGGRESTIWRYRFEPTPGGTRVTESYEAKKLPAWARVMDVPTNRHRDLLKNMRHTLEQLKHSAEGSNA